MTAIPFAVHLLITVEYQYEIKIEARDPRLIYFSFIA